MSVRRYTSFGVLLADTAPDMDAHFVHFEDYRAEVERLRAALDDIASGYACLAGYSAADAAETARNALSAGCAHK